MRLIGNLNGLSKAEEQKNIGKIIGAEGPAGRDMTSTAGQTLVSIDGIKMDDPAKPKPEYWVPTVESFPVGTFIKDNDYAVFMDTVSKPPKPTQTPWKLIRSLLTDYITLVRITFENKTIDLKDNTLVATVEDFDDVIKGENARFGVRVPVPTTSAGELGQWAADDQAFWVYTDAGWKTLDYPTGMLDVHGFNEITDPEDDDEFGIAAANDSFFGRKITWANLKKDISDWYNDLVAIITNKTIDLDDNTVIGTADQFNAALTDPQKDFVFRVSVPADEDAPGKLGEIAYDQKYLWVYQVGGWTKLAWDSEEYTERRLQEVSDQLELEWQQDITAGDDAVRDELGLQISNLGYTVQDIRDDFEDADSKIRLEMALKLDLAVAGLVHGVAVAGIVDDANPGDVDGTTYLVSDTPTGGFAAHAMALATKIDGNWFFQSPLAKETHLNEADNCLYTWDGSQWVKVAQSAGQDQLNDILEAAENYTDMELIQTTNELVQQLQDAHDDLRSLVFDHVLPAAQVAAATPFDPAMLNPLRQELQNLKLADATLKSDLSKQIDAAVAGLAHDVSVMGILAAPPTTSPDDVVYIVDPTPTGVFAGHANQIATKISGVWTFATPAAKETHLNEADGALYTWNGTAWVKVAATVGNTVSGSLAGTPSPLTLWAGTKTQFDALAVKDPKTVYLITAPTAVTTPGGTLPAATNVNVDGGTP